MEEIETDIVTISLSRFKELEKMEKVGKTVVEKSQLAKRVNGLKKEVEGLKRLKEENKLEVVTIMESVHFVCGEIGRKKTYRTADEILADRILELDKRHENNKKRLLNMTVKEFREWKKWSKTYGY